MSVKHLGAGTECPPRDGSKVRLYSMQFCPFSQRARMVLILKNVPHEIVNVNLKDKPDWLFKVHAEGKVPALDTGDRVITESLDIVRYLEQAYPDPALVSSDPDLAAKDTELVQRFSKVTDRFAAAVYDKEQKPLDDYMNEMFDQMDVFERELAARGTLFFGGDHPGYVDYMIWPWSERSKVPSILFNQEFTFPKERFSKLVEWRTAMKAQKGVCECLMDPIRHAKLVQLNKAADQYHTAVDYESV